jgi:putative membrane protein
VKLLARCALLIGLLAVVTIVLHNDSRAIAGLLEKAGWPLLFLVPYHCVPLLLDVLGWRVLIREPNRLRSLFAIAAVREAINRLLPVANVGGEVVGVRLLAHRGISYAEAVGSIVVEITLNILAQILFLMLGLVCLLNAQHPFSVVKAAVLSVAGGLGVVLCLVWILRTGGFFRLIHSIAGRLRVASGKYASALDTLGRIDSITRTLVGDRARLARSVAWQLCGLVSGSVETWLALRLLTHPVTFDVAVVLESLTIAARSVFFIAPAGLGVQEVGLVGFGSLYGLSGEVAIALSLAKRAREILFGLPALAAWQCMRGRIGADQPRQQRPGRL